MLISFVAVVVMSRYIDVLWKHLQTEVTIKNILIPFYIKSDYAMCIQTWKQKSIANVKMFLLLSLCLCLSVSACPSRPKAYLRGIMVLNTERVNDEKG